MVPQKDVDAFKAEMKRVNAKFDVVSYPGVVHAFTNPSASALGEQYDLPLKYDKDADEDSWARLKTFLSSIFSETRSAPKT